jgi:molybdopterin biosynthesis enzyme MoaB
MGFISGGQQSSTSVWQYRSVSDGLIILVKNAWDGSRHAAITITNGGFGVAAYVTTEAQTGTFTDVPYLYR